MDNLARAEFSDDEGEERLEEHVRQLQEVAGPDVVGVIPEERGPCLTRRFWWAPLSHVPLNRARGNLDANLQQFTSNALSGPESVLRCHVLDQRDRLQRDLRLMQWRARFALPEQSESETMPAQDRLGFDNEQCLLPTVYLAREQHQQCPISVVSLGRLTGR